MSGIEIPQDLVDWATLGNWSVTLFEQEGDVTSWANSDGEIRSFVRKGESGWPRAVSFHRGGEEGIYRCGTSRLIASFLHWISWGSVREVRALPLLDVSFEASGGASGFKIVNPDSQGRAVLVNTEGVPLAKSGTVEMAVANLVELSHYLFGSLEALKASFLSPEARPLFSVL